jgi:hypothetical protein
MIKSQNTINSSLSHVRIEYDHRNIYGYWFKMCSNLFTLPFLKPNVQVVFQAILISTQVNSENKVSLSHASLAFTTKNSKETVKRATKKLSELGLLIIHPPTKARDPNSYSLPDIDIIFDKINQLNLKFILETKPNEKIPEIKRFVLENRKIYTETSRKKLFMSELEQKKGSRRVH